MMTARKTENLSDVIRRRLRSTLLPNKKGLVLCALEQEYRGFFGQGIPFQQFGFQDLITFLRSMPEVVTLKKLPGGDLIVTAKADESTSHIQEMVNKQMDNPEGYNRLTSHILSRPWNRGCQAKDSSIVRPATTSIKTSAPVEKKVPSRDRVMIPEYFKKNVKALLDSLQSAPNISTEELERRYRVKFGEINVSDFNCTSIIEILSLLPELVMLQPEKISRTVLVIPVKSIEADSKKLDDSHCDQKSNSLGLPSPPNSSSKEGSSHDAQDERLEVNITEIRDPDKIYVHIRAEYEEYASILNSLMSADKKWDIKPQELIVNKKYALKMEGSWYRIRLISVSESKETCSVFFLDYGFRRDCDKRDLKRLPKTMRGEPFAIHVRMTGVQNKRSDKWSKDSIKTLNQILSIATNGFNSSLICKVDDVNLAEGDISIPVWLFTPEGRNINQEFVRSVEPEKEEEKAIKACVVTRMGSVLTQLNNAELSTEEESSMEKMCMRLERILKDKAMPMPGNSFSKVSNGVGIGKADDTPKMNREPINPDEGPEIHVQTINKPAEHNLSTINLWSKVSLIPSKGLKGVGKGIGLCYLRRSKRLVVSCMEDRKVKMFTSEGHFLKLVTCEEADDGDLKDPSAVVSLADGGFAVSDKTRVLLFDGDGKYIETVWSRKDQSRFKLFECFGLGQEAKERLVLLLDSRDETFLCIIDTQKSEMFCSDVRDIVKDGNGERKPNFKFLSVVGDSFFVTDYGCGKVYVLKYSREGKMVKDTEIRSGEFLKKPAGVSADGQGNIIVADYTDFGKISVFSDEGKWLKNIEVNQKPSTVQLNPDTMELYVLCHRSQDGLIKFVPKSLSS